MTRHDKPRQLSLFGDEPAPEVGPAVVGEELNQLAPKLPAGIRLGTSSWSFPGWHGLVYDRRATQSALAKHGLTAYGQHPLLRAVGLDRTFYAPMAAVDLADYAAAVPEDFRFLVKATRDCTSRFRTDGGSTSREANALYLDSAYANDQVVGPSVEGLGDKLGPLVFQFSPQGGKVTREPERFAARLATFLSALPRGPRYAVELRDRPLLTPAYHEALASAGAVHCASLHPRMPDLAAQLSGATPGLLVVRWMLRAGRDYRSAKKAYAPFTAIVEADLARREALAAACRAVAARGGEAVIIANNKAEGSAPLSVFRLAEAIVQPA